MPKAPKRPCDPNQLGKLRTINTWKARHVDFLQALNGASGRSRGIMAAHSDLRAEVVHAPVCLRDLTADELATVKRLAHSHTAPAQRVQRAQSIWRASCGESASAIAARVGLDGETVRKRIHRFNVEGLEALQDRHRSGRPPTYTPEQTAAVIATALTKPQTLGLPFTSWTLDRLATYLHEAKGIAMQRSRIDEILLHEGLRWRKHETWFGERVDPAFAEKRGGSKRSTPRRLRAVV